MPDDTLKRLLVKLGIDTKDWKVAVKDIKNQLNDVNTQAKADAAKMQAMQKQQLELVKDQVSEQKRLQAEAKTLLSLDQAKAAWEKKNQEALKTKLQQRILETAEVKKQGIEAQQSVRLAQAQLGLERQKLALSQQQTREMQRQQREQAGGGVIGSVGKALSGLAGGGLLGTIISGSFFGTGLVSLFAGVAHGAEALGHSLIQATGPAQQLRETFERLAQGRGGDPTKLLESMRRSTRGLVTDMELFKVGNNFMRSGIKMSDEQMNKLIGTTLNLARANGRMA